MGAELHTPDMWQVITGVTVLDPDGWRSPNAKSWYEPISREEFERRVITSTVSIKRRTV